MSQSGIPVVEFLSKIFFNSVHDDGAWQFFSDFQQCEGSVVASELLTSGFVYLRCFAL